MRELTDVHALAARLERLETGEAARAALYRYAEGADTRDWALLRTCFTDELEVDFSSGFGFPVVRATTFEVEGVHEGAWFGFAHDAVVRIRPGRTDIRVAARDRTRPDGGAACRLAGKLADALEAAAR